MRQKQEAKPGSAEKTVWDIRRTTPRETWKLMRLVRVRLAGGQGPRVE